MLYEHIEKLASNLIDKFNAEPPVDLAALLKAHNISLSEVPSESDDLCGLILKNNKKAIIGVNANHSENRKRFTIAHELGHYLLHTNQDTFVDRHENLDLVKFRFNSDNNNNREEKEANCFAACLLIPKKNITKNYKTLIQIMKDKEEVISSLSKAYAVSFDAMKYRLMNLRLI